MRNIASDDNDALSLNRFWLPLRGGPCIHARRDTVLTSLLLSLIIVANKFVLAHVTYNQRVRSIH